MCVESNGAKLSGNKVGGKVGVNRPGVPPNLPSLSAQLSARSSDRTVELRLVSQPEEQHRARYQTEGSRGAVKDRTGTGHPTVKVHSCLYTVHCKSVNINEFNNAIHAVIYTIYNAAYYSCKAF